MDFFKGCDQRGTEEVIDMQKKSEYFGVCEVNMGCNMGVCDVSRLKK